MSLIHQGVTPAVALATPPAPLTLMAWVIPSTLTGTVPLFGWWTDPNAGGDTGFAVYAQRTDFGPPGVLQGNIRVNGTLNVLTGPGLVIGDRVHIALSYDGTTARLILDGTEVVSANLPGSLPVYSTLTSFVSAASIEDLRVYDEAMDAAAVTAIIAPPPEPDPVRRPAPFPMIEKALKQVIGAKMPDAVGLIGGDLSYDAIDDFYIWLGLVTGQNTEVDGLWTVDIDVFDSHYSQAMNRALELEAILLKSGGHRAESMILDRVYQNEIPMERPWDDESAFRVGATYTFTARRSG